MKDYRSKLEPDNIYHIYNHSVGKESLFIENKNYDFFLHKFEKYLSPYVQVYAFCLMPNHFHFLIEIKPVKFNNIHTCQTPLKVSDRYDSNVTISAAFKSFFTSYTNSFNKLYNRCGSLFQPRYKRLLISSETHLLNAVIYIHNNPVIHGFVQSADDWNYSSYKRIIENNKTDWLLRDNIIQLFGDLENFKFCHSRSIKMYDFDRG